MDKMFKLTLLGAAVAMASTGDLKLVQSVFCLISTYKRTVLQQSLLSTKKIATVMTTKTNLVSVSVLAKICLIT